MKLIPHSFKANGIEHHLLKRSGMIALYGQLNGTGYSSFEIHKIRITKASTMKFGERIVEVPEKETLASNEQFGTYGWAFQTKESAMIKFQELIKLFPT
jgi:hypothetical protein